MIEQPTFFCNSNLGALVESFLDAPNVLATESKTQLKLKFLEIVTSVKITRKQISSAVNQRRCCKEPVLEFEDECIEEKEQDVSTQFLQKQKNQLSDLEDSLERYYNVLPVFGFNSAKNDINLLNSYLLPLLVNERRIEPIVNQKANQFVSFRFGDVQLLRIVNFLGGASSLEFLLKAYKASEAKVVFHLNGSMIQERSTLNNFVLRNLPWQTAKD